MAKQMLFINYWTSKVVLYLKGLQNFKVQTHSIRFPMQPGNLRLNDFEGLSSIPHPIEQHIVSYMGATLNGYQK
jgi:hypothetical protein